MKTYTPEELKAILAKHLKYVLGEEGGERENLSGANLSRANLSRANLSGANLSWAVLSGADLSRANLSDGVDIISVSGIGSERRMTTYWVQADKVWCGCFTGTLAKFKEEVESTHKDNPKHLATYRAAIALFEAGKGGGK